MRKIKAIVLTYDEQRGLAQLVIKAYESLLGEELPFEFLIPYQSKEAYADMPLDNITLIATSSSSIRATMNALLKGIDDNEWVFWCIDDRYPVNIDKKSFLCLIQELNQSNLKDFDGIKLTKWEEPVETACFELFRTEFQKQSTCGMTGFWHHQFLKAKVLREVFINSEEYNNDIRLLNNRFHKQHELCFLENVLVPKSSIVWFKEPLKQGLLTLNGVEDLKKFNCPVPEYDTIEHNIYFKPVDER